MRELDWHSISGPDSLQLRSFMLIDSLKLKDGSVAYYVCTLDDSIWKQVESVDPIVGNAGSWYTAETR